MLRRGLPIKTARNIWADPDVKFLDPVTKSGVFFRGDHGAGLSTASKISSPISLKCVDRVLTNQVYGIGITRLTTNGPSQRVLLQRAPK